VIRALIAAARLLSSTAAAGEGAGGTRGLWNALQQEQVDVYPEYTGTLRQELLPNACPGR
jgi:osmoprotectant transport system permease protein